MAEFDNEFNYGMDRRKGVSLTSAMTYPQRYVYQGQINKKRGTKFNILVTYYSQPMIVIYGGSAKEAGLDGNIVRATKLSKSIRSVPVKKPAQAGFLFPAAES